jgi:hypothetical protein
MQAPLLVLFRDKRTHNNAFSPCRVGTASGLDNLGPSNEGLIQGWANAGSPTLPTRRNGALRCCEAAGRVDR